MSSEGISYDNVVVRALNRLGDVMVLSLLTLLFSVPIFTIGASLTAGYYTAMHGVTKDDGYIWKKFIKSFKENFKQSTLMWLIFMGLFIVFGVDVWFWQKAYTSDQGGFIARVLLVVSVVLLALTVMTFIFAFPLQAKFDNKIKVQLRNAFLLGIKYVPTTLIIVVTMAVVAIIYYYQLALAVVGFALVGNGALLYFFAYLMMKCFKVYLEPAAVVTEEADEDEEAEDEEADEAVEEEKSEEEATDVVEENPKHENDDSEEE